jgi:hypothetical protein
MRLHRIVPVSPGGGDAKPGIADGETVERHATDFAHEEKVERQFEVAQSRQAAARRFNNDHGPRRGVWRKQRDGRGHPVQGLEPGGRGHKDAKWRQSAGRCPLPPRVESAEQPADMLGEAIRHPNAESPHQS